MGKLDAFGITLNNQQRVYYAGQNIDGFVTVALNDAMKMRSVKLVFKGSAYVHWTEQHSTGSGKNKRTETRHYSASETYFDFQLILQGSDTTKLPAGQHFFPFSFLLPPNLPSSYESHTGNVRYKLKAKIDKPWKFDHETKTMFTVISVLDLNQDPKAALAAQDEKSKHLCCLCCRSGPMHASFRIDRSGYVPGDTIHLNAEISNMTRRSMPGSKVRLIMTTHYHATSKTKTVSKEVLQLSRGKIERGGSDIWSGETMHVPSLPPSYLVGCSIIDIRFTLQFEVNVSFGFDLEIPLEVIIGTIPLRQVVQQYYPQPVMPQPAMPSAPYNMPGASAPPMGLPPPSYSECVFGKAAVGNEEGDTEHTGGDKDFAPSYPYYDWSKHKV